MSTYVRKIKHEEANVIVPADIQAHYVEELTIMASSTVTANGATGDIDVGDYIEGWIIVDVTAVSGTTPTLDLAIELKDPASGKYVTVATFPQITAVGTYGKQITNFGRYIRVRWTLGGTTPSFTFSLGGVFKA